eukprot:CAMPEP_0194774350 /NCGR_PEP_ID=MMETSP0323_2-20130528/57373_1 /TAXON_ID=2866 ORGANISM="Crypthecodinium cohnii, Strain Seligo" /NCGR_SAMPLE_ID=MMETSP0323_2 /ASSEMBLY_ACC=CAM_ASM_000346 /LENGTH=48 /DNA_ID= /DNA_START= /DNA_END= /DNA_ORIENTATION=
MKALVFEKFKTPWPAKVAQKTVGQVERVPTKCKPGEPKEQQEGRMAER